MRFAYADPPYPGCAHLYRGHPDYAGEVDHAALIERLCQDYPDGWALSSNGDTIQYVLGLCPQDVRVAIWHRTDATPPPGGNAWHWCWEPVIVRGGRRRSVRTVLQSGVGASSSKFTGAKPPVFTRWMLDLLGAEPADTVDDLFPGSGAVGRAIESWRRQPRLPVFTRSEVQENRLHPGRLARNLKAAGHAGLF